MDINHLRAFLTVAEELHFGRAADRLHLAQPPVSRMIRRLESDLGVQLFERSTRSVTLTSVGEALLAPAQGVLDSVERMRRAARAAGQGEIGRVRLAYAGASSNSEVGRLARAVKQNHPGIQFELLSQHFAQPAMQLVVRGDVDIALGRWDLIPFGVSTRVLARESLVVAVADTHPLADRSEVALSEFDGEPFVALQPQTGTLLLDRLRHMTQEAGVRIDIVQDAPDSWAVMSLVSAEVGSTLTLSSVVDSIADPHVRFLPLSDITNPVELRMAWRSDPTDRALSAVLALSEQVLPTPAEEVQEPR